MPHARLATLLATALLVATTHGHAEPANLMPTLDDASVETLDHDGIGGVHIQRLREDPELGPVYRVTTNGFHRDPFSLGTLVRTVRDVPKKHALHLRFMIRRDRAFADDHAPAIEVGLGWPDNFWQRRTQRTAVRPTHQWQRIELGLNARRDEAAGELALILGLGPTPTTLEIADVQLIDHGPDLHGRTELPYTRLTYPGQEPDAPWRIDAHQRIEKLRKADLALRVVDEEGLPVPGATVRVEMQRHGFGFGTAIKEQHIAAYAEPDHFDRWHALSAEDHQRYITELKRLFSMAVTENGLKWHRWEQPEQCFRTMASLRWLTDRGFDVRGHTLYWGHWKWMPKDVRYLENDLALFRQRVAGHVVTATSAAGPYLQHLDLVNEPFTWHEITDRLGEDAVVEWFKLAHRAAPHVRLYVNENESLTHGAKIEPLERMVASLLDKGAPVHGVGFQAHFHWAPTPPQLVLDTFDRFADLGLEVAITELDFAGPDEQLKADQLRDLLIASFSHPATAGFLVWGFWDGAHYANNGVIFNRDWSLKPTGRVWMDLVMDQWWTRDAGSTDDHGRYAVRGFKGDYAVVVEHDGISTTHDIALTDNTDEVTVVLAEPDDGA